MLPVKLVIQAFESYADQTEIDFERLDSLFLIHGETGAGKTAVLDAVTYALYGESSGGERTDMRCALPAAENLPTMVEFTFKIRGELYKFTRSITVTPRSKKLEARQDCFYFDKTSDCFRAFFENPKQTFVRAKAEELTGLSAEQFR
ncbi:MAG: AAA family ATPase, partial [Oscillospiraceae bacterium]|nr:AAA family ATPase [Oscillospiraceae bacterium]